jgi:hypothetical protein
MPRPDPEAGEVPVAYVAGVPTRSTPDVWPPSPTAADVVMGRRPAS